MTIIIMMMIIIVGVLAQTVRLANKTSKQLANLPTLGAAAVVPGAEEAAGLCKPGLRIGEVEPPPTAPELLVFLSFAFWGYYTTGNNEDDSREESQRNNDKGGKKRESRKG
jgi:hypothetical protein